ncbi:hypothetical protein PoB_005162300 [Plakobranchus ocellatus]|uniref:Uncharacterized protein n=1 Tax=Plakobranchus ocellatus TaxID=259542 RepID=A0AAV4BZQ7_9GAST|nr:hypothetical protein PoB_005162300 [Plakobranchus ocellatus]
MEWDMAHSATWNQLLYPSLYDPLSTYANPVQWGVNNYPHAHSAKASRPHNISQFLQSSSKSGQVHLATQQCVAASCYDNI